MLSYLLSTCEYDSRDLVRSRQCEQQVCKCPAVPPVGATCLVIIDKCEKHICHTCDSARRHTACNLIEMHKVWSNFECMLSLRYTETCCLSDPTRMFVPCLFPPYTFMHVHRRSAVSYKLLSWCSFVPWHRNGFRVAAFVAEENDSSSSSQADTPPFCKDEGGEDQTGGFENSVRLGERRGERKQAAGLPCHSASPEGSHFPVRQKVDCTWCHDQGTGAERCPGCV